MRDETMAPSPEAVRVRVELQAPDQLHLGRGRIAASETSGAAPPRGSDAACIAVAPSQRELLRQIYFETGFTIHVGVIIGWHNARRW